MMFAVIRTGGKQYRVAEDNVLRIDKIEGNRGDIIQFGEVLVLGGDKPQVGAGGGAVSAIAGASVAAEVIDQVRGDKVIAFKKRRRKNSRRKRGHRQDYTMVRISEILMDGAKPTKGPRPKPERKVKPETVEGDEAETSAEKATAKKTAAKKAPAKKAAAKKAAKPAAKKAAPKAKK
jgi:large subunit ribosomal protein L21